MTDSRSARIIEDHYAPSASDGNAVGPGSYVEHKSWATALADEPVTAFHTRIKTKEIRPHVGKLSDAWANPGPGAYAPARSSPARGGHSALRSGAPQISPIIENVGASEFLPSTNRDNPGPADYAVPHCGSPHPIHAAADRSWKEGAPQGEKVKLAAAKSHPSIPAEVRETKLMRYTGREDHQDAIGPADYPVHNVSVESVTRREPRDANFHSSDSVRKLWEPSCSIENVLPDRINPAPGTYKVTKQLTKGTSCTFTSGAERPCLDKDPPSKLQVPGPGSYTADTLAVREEPLPDPSLRSSSERRGCFRPALDMPYTDPDNVHHVPGPGAYNQLSPAFATGRRARSTSEPSRRRFHGVHQPAQLTALRGTDGKQLCGFASSDDRPVLKEDVQTTPSPGAYGTGRTLASDVTGRETIGRKGVFGSTADRASGWALAAHSEGGEPAGYKPRRKTQVSQAKTYSPFVSEAPRFADEKPVGNPIVDWHGTPSPGQYESNKIPDYRSPFRQGKTHHLSFGASGSRPDATSSTSMTPCPGEYNPVKKAARAKGAAKCTSDRRLAPALSMETLKRPDRNAGVTGPGSYNIVGTMLPITFNVSAARHAAKNIGKSHSPSNVKSTSPSHVKSTSPFRSQEASTCAPGSDELSMEKLSVESQLTLSMSMSDSWIGGAGGGHKATKARMQRNLIVQGRAS